MSNYRFGFVSAMIALASLPVAVDAAALGPDASLCESGARPAILVRVVGLKNRVGPVRIRTFGGSPATYFDKRTALKRTEVNVPANGPVEICMAVPGPGTYAVDLRHDANRNGKTDQADGGGTSGNPKVSMFDMLFKRKPAASQVAVKVGHGVAVVPIVVNYVQGGSIKPISAPAR
jgi:uncharacterized protein (DUF2141 family)